MALPKISKAWEKAVIGLAIAGGIAFTAANWDEVTEHAEKCYSKITSAMRP